MSYINENGQLHRLNGPAISTVNGSELWYCNGKRHRLDGPAVQWSDGENTWYINNVHMTDRKRFQQQTGISDEEITILILKYGEIK